ncbi:hypothetical protein [Streptomyces sp. SM13]|uniref:hypothetical protein n=1 Tax=Streptomyces sp. SM13 TaxID=1983803 RepID=UPI000CD52F7F|nr:hypothetical protein [Streptomyces sp. SM13]
MKRTIHRSAGIIAAGTAGALVLTIAPTAADSGLSTAERVATVVEKTTGTADISRDGQSGVTTPATADGTISAAAVDGSRISIRLPGAGSSSAAETGTGTIVYPGAAKNADLAVQPTAQGVRALITVNNANAAKEYRFGLGLPDGATAEQLDGGGVLVTKGEDVLGMFDAPGPRTPTGKPFRPRTASRAVAWSRQSSSTRARPRRRPLVEHRVEVDQVRRRGRRGVLPSGKGLQGRQGSRRNQADGEASSGARTKGDFIKHAKKAGKNGAVEILGIAGVGSYCFK